MMDGAHILAFAAASSGSFLDRWVLEQPWPLAGGLIGAGMLAIYVLASRGEGKRGAGIGGVCVAAGLGVLIAGYSITTTREHLFARGQQLVDAFFAANAGAVGERLNNNLKLTAAGQDVRAIGRESLMLMAAGSKVFEVQRHDYTPQAGGTSSESRAHTRFRVRVYTPLRGYSGVPLTTTWDAEWQRSGGNGWRITSLDLADCSDGVPTPGMIEHWRGLAGK